MSKPDIRCIVREDWVDYSCPCGVAREGHSWDREGTVMEWLSAHAQHSSGFVSESSDASWSKFLSDLPKDKRWQIKEPA